MTRLITEWVSEAERSIREYDLQLRRKFGFGLCGIAAASCGYNEEELADRLKKHRGAVVPFTCGEGVIGHFAEAVQGILLTMGLDTFVTEHTDVDGIYEGISHGADILFMADEIRYLAMNVKTGALGDNNIATAAGFGTALKKLAGGLSGKKVLVMGCGIIGQEASAFLQREGAKVSLLDKNNKRAQELATITGADIVNEGDIGSFELIFDATNEGGWLSENALAEKVYIAAPGVPLSLTAVAEEKYRTVTVHDCLQIGTAVMLGMVV